ncbi:MAG: S9 family peptidase [Thermoanaerobaculia bacterium]
MRKSHAWKLYVVNRRHVDRLGGARGVAALLLVGALAWAPPAPAADGAESAAAAGPELFRPADVFDLEWAEDPRIAPDGERVVYVRRGMDVMRDQRRSELWVVGVDGEGHRPLVTEGDPSSPRWSPDGTRLAYVAGEDEDRQLHVRWLDSGQTVQVTRGASSPSSPAWSPDGQSLAFTRLVEEEPESMVEMPPRPEGAEWAEEPRVVDGLVYRADGRGFLPDGFRHVFVVPAAGGTPRQVTSGAFHHDGPVAWTPDGAALLVSANRHEDWRYEPLDSEVYEVSVEDGSIRALTDRRGPDEHPVPSPDGERIAYLGFDDRYQGYQVTRLYVMDRDGGDARVVTEDLDRSVEDPAWSADGDAVYVQYDDRETTRIARVSLDGEVTDLAKDVGGTSIGRPYSSGSFTLGPDGRFAFTRTGPHRPADVGVGGGEGAGEGAARVVTGLNEDLLAHRELGRVEEIRYASSHDGREIQGWIVTPPGFDPSRTYPLILEIHGGPFANYGARWSAEAQLYAAAGYTVLYTNPRGSTGYGEEFGNLIHHAYPGHDYDDLMSGVDAVLERGWADPERLYITGGSGGGVLTAWSIGKTDRFRAAVVAKPVINWYSFALTADMASFFYKYWFPGLPWEHLEHYMARSPISLVGEVDTPTMLLTGEADHRTPMSETEQYYQALKLRNVDSVMVRIPGASHGIAERPSQLVAKVLHVLAWFDRH